MQDQPARHIALTTLITAAIGACGATLAYGLSVPAWVLIGPAAAVSIAALSGLKTGIADPVRDGCFVILGLGIGAGVDPNTSSVILRWPMAFVVLAVTLFVIMALCRYVLIRGFGFDQRSASLAAAPGHLSFVLGLASTLHTDVARIAVVQSIRLLFLTLSVPFIGRAMGYDLTTLRLSDGPAMSLLSLCVLALAALGSGLVLQRLRFPAPLLMAAMAVSAIGHLGDWTPGSVPGVLTTPALLVLGTLIGTRFSDTTVAQFRSSILAGLATTLISVSVASLAAVAIAVALDMPAPHVLAAFAPGGLETMIALGATMGANAGFVAACHVARLLILIVLIPLFLKHGSAEQSPR